MIKTVSFSIIQIFCFFFLNKFDTVLAVSGNRTLQFNFGWLCKPITMKAPYSPAIHVQVFFFFKKLINYRRVESSHLGANVKKIRRFTCQRKIKKIYEQKKCNSLTRVHVLIVTQRQFSMPNLLSL